MVRLRSIFNFLRMVVIRNKFIEKPDSIFRHSFTNESNSGFDRENFLIDISKENRVLHFGFLDSPFLREKFDQRKLLHVKLRKESNFLFGLDINKDDLQEYRKISGDSNNALYNIEIDSIEQEFLKKSYDVILFPEVLEHISNPGIVASKLLAISRMNKNCKTVFTVPNAFNVYGFINAVYGIETVHPDHVAYYSPYTLKNLLSKVGFTKIDISFYIGNSSLFSPGLTKYGLIAVCQP